MRSKLSKSLWMLMVGAAAVFGSGCEEEPKKPTEDVVAPEPAKAKEVAPSGPVDKLATPEPVIIYGGVDKASDMAGHLADLMLGSPTQGAAQMDDAVKAAAMRLGLKDGKALDTNKPLRVAIVDPKANEQPYMIAVGIKSRDDFAKSLPEKHKKDDAGNAFSYVTGGSQPVFVNYVDDWAVFTGKAELFGAHKAFMVKLIGATVRGDAGLVIDVAHLTKLYGLDLTKAIEEMKVATAAQGALPVGGMDKLYDFIKTVANDLDKVIVSTKASKESGRLQFDLIAKAGTDLDKSFKDLSARKLEPMLARLPADAPAALVASFDPDSDSDLMRSLTAWSMQLALGQGAAEKDYSDALNTYWKGSTGEMAMVAHQHEGALRLSMLAGVRDVEKVRTSMDTMRGMYKEEGFKKLYKEMGLSYDFKKGAYKVGAVSVDSVRAKFTKKAGDDKPALEQAMGGGADFLTQLMSHDFAITDDTVFSVYGTDAKKVMEAWIGGKVDGGLDKTAGVQRALNSSAPGTFFMFYGSPLAVAQAMQEPGAAAPEAGNGIALSAGSTGNVVHIVLDVPGDQAQALMKMMGSLGGGL